MDSSPSHANEEPSAQIDLSVVIVNYNVCEFLIQTLRSVEQASRDLSVETWVVDNNSIDDSLATVSREFPGVKVIANDQNVGFGAANNQAILRARGEYILILNPDTIVQEDTLVRLKSFMDSHEDCGALGCQILNPDGSFAPESRRSFPTPETAFYRMTGLGRLFPRSKRFGRYNLTYLEQDQESEVDALSGSCMLVRRDALLSENGAGLFDEDFFMYGEDLDLCYRIKKAGWKIWYTPSTQIIHYKGESTKKGELKYVRLFYGAMLLFLEKHVEGQHSTILASMLRAGVMIRAGISLISASVRRATPLVIDFLGVYLSVLALGYLRYEQTGGSLSVLFYFTTAPAYAIATVVAIASAGGYRRGGRRPSSPVFIGLLIGFLFVASLSFFIQSIAFSRWVVVASFPLSLLLLLSWRFASGRGTRGPRKAVLVGEQAEAQRLARLLIGHPRPPFRILGFVSEEKEGHQEFGPSSTDISDEQIPPRLHRLGRLTNLRDLVRIREFDDIVFAARDISNQTIFNTMRELKDLSVQFRMLSEGRDHIIGKSSVSRLSVGSLSANPTEIVELRSPFSKSLFEKLFSLIVLPLTPVLWLISTLTPRNSLFRSGIQRLWNLWSVLLGEKALIGHRKVDEDLIPTNWNLRPGVFAVTNTMPADELESGEIVRAYWYYVTHQTPGLDLEIILASFRAPTSRDRV